MSLFSFIFGKRAIYKKDAKSGGYVVHYKKHKGIRGQGATKKEALENLNRDIKRIEYLRTNNETNNEFSPKTQVAHT